MSYQAADELRRHNEQHLQARAALLMYMLRQQGAWQELTHYFDDDNQYSDEDVDEESED